MSGRPLGRIAAAELLKLARARFGRILLVTSLVSVTLPVTLIGVLGDRNMTTFPGVVIHLLLPTLTLLAGLASLLLAVSIWGQEYTDGTLRIALIRCPSRGRLLAGKMAALAVGLAAVILAALAVEVLVAGLSHGLQLGGRGLAGHLWTLARISVPLAAIWWLCGLVYAGLIILVTVASRSAALGMAAGLALFLADFTLSSLGPSGPDSWIMRYLVTNNGYALITPLVAGRYDVTAGGMFAGLAAQSLPAAPDALLTLLGMAGGSLLLAYALLARRDVG